MEPERRLAELESTLAEVKLDAANYAPLLGPLVGFPVPSERLPTLSPEETRRRQLTAMVEWAMAGARFQPVVLVFEDLQWFDPTSIDLVHALSERGTQGRLLILATARPEFRPPWGLRPHHRVISLVPLDEAQVQRMIAELASQRTLSTDMIRGVSERAGGVPLFVEEVMRLILERGVRGGARAIPPTLRQSLAARLDQLGSAREVAQIGAVLGRSFSYGFCATSLFNLLLAIAPPRARQDLPRPANGNSMNSRFNPLWTVSSARTFCSQRAGRRRRSTASSMR